MPQPAQNELKRFSKIIIQWSKDNPRPLPWKSFSDPYHIWIAEIILQQTRVEQGTPYFEKFIKHFPDLQSLATASMEEVLVVWEGLGYYSRARNLHESARYIFYDLKGCFPEHSKDLLRLKGVGPYTAAAIASFAFEEEIGVVDGNVKRVISRFFHIFEEINSSATHKRIQTLVNQMVKHHSSAEFNQAIMNFGALKCIPGQPECANCPASRYCKAYELDKVDQLPYKARKQKKQKRWLHFGVYVKEGQIALIQNEHSNIWKNLYLFPVIGAKTGFSSFLESKEKPLLPDLPLIEKMEWVLSHRRLNLYFYRLGESPSEWAQKEGIRWVESENLANFALPRPLRLFLKRNSCKLGLNLKDDK